MTNSSPVLEKGEFVLIAPALYIMAPIAYTDEQGELLYEMSKPDLEKFLAEMKDALEKKFPEIRVGYDVA